MHIIESENMYHIYQDLYMSKIKLILFDAEFSSFSSTRMRLAWIGNTRLDMIFEISQIAQATRTGYEKEIIKHCKRLNKEIKYVHDHQAS